MSVTEAQTSREIEIRLSQLQQHVACDSSGETRHLATTRRSLFMPYSKQIHCISDCHFRMSFNPCTGSTLAGFHALVLAAKLKAQSRQVTAQPLHGSAQTDRGARTRIHRDTHTHTHPHTHTHTHTRTHTHTLWLSKNQRDEQLTGSRRHGLGFWPRKKIGFGPSLQTHGMDCVKR